MAEILPIGPVSPAGARLFTAGEDLTADRGKAVKISSGSVIKVTAATDDAIGVLLTGGANGADVTVALFGEYPGSCYVAAGGALATAHVRVKFDATARFVAAVATDRSTGRIRGTASGAGALVETVLNYPTTIV